VGMALHADGSDLGRVGARAIDWSETLEGHETAYVNPFGWSSLNDNDDVIRVYG
jgi:hypothetical protein